MKQAEDFLQALLEQVEAGAPVEATVQGLPEQEAELVQFISALRHIPYPVEEQVVVAAQELEFLEAAQAQFPPISSESIPADQKGMADYIDDAAAWVAGLNWKPEFAMAGAVALVVLILMGVGLLGRPSTETTVEESDEAVAIVDETISEEPADSSPTQTPETEIAELETAVPTSTPHTEIQIASALTLIAPPAQPGDQMLFLPMVGVPIEMNAQTAVIENIIGLVEVQQSSGEWTVVSHMGALSAGQRIRTSALSQATLTFFDSSQAVINAESELSIDQLNALRPAQGFRTVVMTQWVGESNHSVQFRNDGGSRYEVKTPTGSGLARGTQFQVLVLPNQRTRFVVTEGKVDVTNANATVSIVGGQLTSFTDDTVPTPPNFLVTGEGEVESTGESWVIAGQTFQTNAQTIIVGNPQPGDLVKVEGHLLDDGSQLADRIVLLQQSISNRFSLSGEVTQMGANWVVAGQEIVVDGNTAVSPTIVLNDEVLVTGRILADGTLVAESIIRQYPEFGLPFSFSGVVQVISPHQWQISGQIVHLAEETTIIGAVAIGSIVQVQGVILENDQWVAIDIQAAEPQLTAFEFQGVVNQIAPWIVGGIPFETRTWSIVDPKITLGSEVQVTGSILPDGTRVATSIQLVNEAPIQIVRFTGTVTGIDPWLVNGLPLTIDADTIVLGNLELGVKVRVIAVLLADGRWRVLSIWVLTPEFGQGCFILSSPITAVNANGVQLKHWPEIIDDDNDDELILPDDLKIDDVITLPICVGGEGQIIIIGEIELVYRPIIIIINPGNGGGNNAPPGCRDTSNGGIECSRRSSRRS